MRRTHRLSIIWKITIWYTIFLCLLAFMIVAVTYHVSGRIVKNSSRNHLISVVEEATELIEYDDGVLEIDDEMDFLNHGVYLSVYNQDNDLLLGVLPKNFESTDLYLAETVETITIAQEEWYLYEKEKELEDFGVVTMRGMVALTTGLENQSVTTKVLIFMSPLIIIVATVGGYLITKRAFLPVNQMRKTVEQISSGKDLTKRLNLGDEKDELYKLAKTFDQMFERLEDAFEREKQFTSDVSHELRTTVSVILSHCEYALEQQNGAETQKALQNIYQRTIRMSNMIGQLLVLSRSDQGFVMIQAEEVSISELLEVIVEDARERAKEKNIMIYTDIAENLIVQGDETMLVRFFMNLISNAICYGKEGGFVRVSLSKEEDCIVGAIQDNGIGIAEEEQEKIWRRFYQVSSSRTSTKDGGVGLGLSMVQWIAKAHGGDISVESKLGEGATFRFWIPVKGPSSNE